ncbi:MAG: hypothetical protein GY795_17725 [Desulfobacterales bacterium]|nr:hypothetical protein [Desulfobacterales bacterium]
MRKQSVFYAAGSRLDKRLFQIGICSITDSPGEILNESDAAERQSDKAWGFQPQVGIVISFCALKGRRERCFFYGFFNFCFPYLAWKQVNNLLLIYDNIIYT